MYDNNRQSKQKQGKCFKQNQNQERSNPSRSKHSKQASTSQRKKGQIKMFQSDNDARRNAIESDKLAETKRHNKAQENISRTTGIMQGVGTLTRGVLNPFKVNFKGGNHPSWYLQDTSLAQQSTAISDKIPIGKNQKVINICRNVDVAKDFGDGNAVIAVYDYIPVISLYDGEPASTLSKISANVYDKAPNYISKALYTAVKQACRRNLQYTPSDVIRTILIVMDIFCNLEVMKRVYRVANTYRFLNQTVGDHLLRMLGFNVTSVRENLSDLLFRVNRLGKMLATVRVPKGQTLYDRWMLLASAVFKDRDCERSRLFAFRKLIAYMNTQGEVYGTHSIPRISKAVMMNGASQETVALQQMSWDYSDVLYMIERQIYSLLNNGDILSCLADINTAFESSGFWEFTSLAADETQEFGYDEIMKNQVRNAVITGHPLHYEEDGQAASGFHASDFDLYDVGNGNLVQGSTYLDAMYPVLFSTGVPSVAFTSQINVANVFGSSTPRIGIDTPVDSPDAGILLTVSRLCPVMEDSLVFDVDHTAHLCRIIRSHGTEIITGVKWSATKIESSNQGYDVFYSSYGPTAPIIELQSWAKLQCFDSVPRKMFMDMRLEFIVRQNRYDVSVLTTYDPIVIGDMVHVVYCDDNLISRWHFIAVASEYAIPNVIKV